MNWTKLRHIALITGGLLAAFAGVVYQGSLANQNITPLMTFGILASLVAVMWSRAQAILGKASNSEITRVQQIWNLVIGLAGMVAPICVLISGQFAPGSKYFIIGGFLSTFLGDLAKSGPIVPVAKQLILALAVTALLCPATVRAEVTPSSVAPPLSFCIGKTTHCVMPDFNLNVVNYDLGKKKWDAGTTSLAVGYMLIFYSDQPWASGVALHGTGKFLQAGGSYFAIVPTLVFAKYFEAGATFSFGDGYIDKSITLGMGANWDFLSGKTTAVRLGEARRLEAAGGAQ